MASLAGLLKQRGSSHGLRRGGVSADVGFLASISIPVAQPYSEANLKPAAGHGDRRQRDLCAAIQNWEYVLDERIFFRSMPDILYDLFLRTRQPLVVAGTLKTTLLPCWHGYFSRGERSIVSVAFGGSFGSSFALRPGQVLHH